MLRNVTHERRTKQRLDTASSSRAPAPVTPAIHGPPPAFPGRVGYHHTVARLPPYYFECYQKLENIPGAAVRPLSMESLFDHYEDWHRNVLDALTHAGLLELTMLAANFPEVALQKFWATFDLDEHKSRQHKKVVTFYLGGVYRTLTYDEFAARLGIPHEHYEGHNLGWENDDDDGEEYHALLSHMTGVPIDHLTKHNSIKSLSHPLYKFIHMVWCRSLLYAPEKDRHHISRVELLLLRAI